MKEEKGQIKVTVQTQNRLEAINNLSSAINKVASALTTPIYVTVQNCHLAGEVGVNIDTADEVHETSIVEVPNEN